MRWVNKIYHSNQSWWYQRYCVDAKKREIQSNLHTKVVLYPVWKMKKETECIYKTKILLDTMPKGQKVVFKSLTNYTKTANSKCLIAPLRTMMASKS